MENIEIRIHGQVGTVEAFEELAGIFANFYSHRLDKEHGVIKRHGSEVESLEAAENLLFHMHDYEGRFWGGFEPEGTIAALMQCCNRNCIDITVSHTDGSRGDGYVSFVRGGGEPISLQVVGGEVAVTARTISMLQERGMCSLETIKRLLAVSEDAQHLPRFRLSDDVFGQKGSFRR
jgi:hypothetical protein